MLWKKSGPANTANTATVMAGLGLMLALAAYSAPVLAKGKPACKMNYIPLAEGNHWVFQNGALQLVVRVVAVENDKPTRITVEETLGEHTVSHQWTCDPKEGLIVHPESFFFAGEAGGGYGLKSQIEQHKGVTLVPDKLLKSGENWQESVAGTGTRSALGDPKSPFLPARFEVERYPQVVGPERVLTSAGNFKTLHLSVDLRGRGIVAQERIEFPVKRPAAFYLVKGVGPIRVLDAFENEWYLVESNLLNKK